MYGLTRTLLLVLRQATIRPSWLAKLLCRCFHPTSSVATACGMQALMDIVGSVRIIAAVVAGIVAKVFRVAGMFYRIAGWQSKAKGSDGRGNSIVIG